MSGSVQMTESAERRLLRIAVAKLRHWCPVEANITIDCIDALLAQPASEAEAASYRIGYVDGATGQSPQTPLKDGDKDALLVQPEEQYRNADSGLYGPEYQGQPEGAEAGWVLVPREPTEAMLEAAWPSAANANYPHELAETYHAMLAASPANEEKPCKTCDDDPAECATVPGLRHCEKANR